jgi:hypothetical protein
MVKDAHTDRKRRLKQSTESPIFDASFRSENGVSCSHERNKIGDSVLWFEGIDDKSGIGDFGDCKVYGLRLRAVPIGLGREGRR